MKSTTCPGLDELQAFRSGNLANEPRNRLADHLAACDACQSTIRSLEAQTATETSSADESLGEDPFVQDPHCRQALADAEAAVNQVGDGSDRGPAADESKPAMRRLGQYELLEKLGQGGMGTVFKARHPKLKRVVALKVLPADQMAKPEAVARFHREMEAIGQLDHPNIVRATDAGESDGTHYLVMEFVDGIDLGKLIGRCGRLAIPDACELVRQAALGLQHVHVNGLVHRDIKPSNLLLTRTGQVKVADLGLALLHDKPSGTDELTGEGQILGTLDYLAPEQAFDTHTVDIRADLYSLGCTLYHLLVGQAPFCGPQFQNALKKTLAHAQVPARPVRELRPEVPDPLAAIVHRLLAKDPAARFATPAEVAAALVTFTSGCNLEHLFESSPESSPHAPREESGPRQNSIRQPAVPHAERTEREGVNDAASQPAVPHAEREGYDNALAEPTPVSPAAEAQVDAPSPKPRRPWRVLTAVAVLALFGLLAVAFAPGIYRIVTNQGVIVIQSHDPELEVSVQRNGEEVSILDPVSNQKITLAAGNYEFEIKKGKDGLKLRTKQFTLERNGRKIVEVYFEPKVAAKDKDTGRAVLAPSSDPDRSAAEYVLSIGGKVQVNDEEHDIAALADLPKDRFHLTAIFLERNQKVTAAGLAQFRDCKYLTYLCLQYTPVTDAGLAEFRDCKNLTRLDLQYTGVTGAGLAHFKNCKNLTHLYLTGTRVTDAGLAHFSDCKNLTLLYLDRATRVGDSGLVQFKDCTNLTYLYLDSTQVTDAGLTHFRDCKNLTGLRLNSTQVTDAGLAHFQDCKKLTYLYLQDTRVSDAGLASFQDCTNLKALVLADTQVTDAGLAHFKNCKNLTQLVLRDTRVTDAGLSPFKDCKNLLLLSLQKTKVTAAMIGELKKALPRCKIEWDGGVIEPAPALPPGAPAGTGRQLVFEDTFDGRESVHEAERWRDGIENGKLFFEIGPGRAGEGKAFPWNHPASGNFECQMRVRTSGKAYRWVIFRTMGNDQQRTELAFGIGPSGDWKLVRWFEGPDQKITETRTLAVEHPDPPVGREGEWIDLRIVAVGKTIRLEVDGRLLKEIEDTYEPPADFKPLANNLRTWSLATTAERATVELDYLRVWRIDSCAEAR